jgi:hypothetical protein
MLLPPFPPGGPLILMQFSDAMQAGGYAIRVLVILLDSVQYVVVIPTNQALDMTDANDFKLLPGRVSPDR